jgi:outer membrane protein OmpA-like peptidoglycan-associated protein
MYQWQPSKWIQFTSFGALLPFLCAAAIQSSSVVKDVTERATLAAAGPTVEIDGRDAKLSGEVPSQDALDAAKKNVEATYGVRLVDVSNVKIVPPAPPPAPAPVTLAAPTVEPITTTEAQPMIMGTWPEGAAKTLEVTAAGKTYALGKDPELTSSAGKWMLMPSAPIPAGSYDVTAMVSDGDKATASTAAPAKVVIEAPKVAEAVKPAETPKVVEAPKPAPLKEPTVTSVTTNNVKPEIKGTYPTEAAKLMVELGGTSYELGKSPELTVDASGNWTLKPAAALPDGETKVTAKVADATGTVSSGSAPTPIVVDSTPPAAPSLSLPAAADAVWPFAITGKWDEMPGNNLAIDFNNKSYALGKDKELISDGKGAFTFVPTEQMPPGKYDLNLIETDSVGNETKLTQKEAIIVAPPPPPPPALTAPTIDTLNSDKAMPTITGTWQAGIAKGLTVDVAGVSHVLGKDYDLLTDANGKWSLTPKAEIANGTYDVVATVVGADGATLADATKDELTVNVPPPPPPPALVAPTVDTVSSDKAMPTITGTWAADIAKGLTVAVGGVTHTLGTDSDLSSEAGGKWTLTPKAEIPNGTYDVVATVMGADGASLADATKDELTVNVPPPPPPPPAAVKLTAPTVETSTSDSDHPTVKGTWPAGVAKTLTVDLDGVKHKLGTDFDLLTDSNGKWTLTPKAPVVNGTYDVVATVTDGDKQSVSDTTKGELTVAVAPPPPPPPPAQPYDCEATLARIAAVFPVHFETDKADLLAPNDLSVNQYAALLKDPRCATLKVQLGGHADERGSESYNQSLSERRAQTVLEALKTAGIDGARLSAVGFSKDKPLDPSHTADAHRKNRRAEFTIVK